MRIIAKRTLRQFWRKHPDAGAPLRAWHDYVKRAHWTSPEDVRSDLRSASVVGNSRVVFNIKGNEYRLVAAIHYNTGLVFVRFIGNHQDYGKIDVEYV